MPDDLVVRLRRRARETVEQTGSVEWEAANEIERMRKLLGETVDDPVMDETENEDG